MNGWDILILCAVVALVIFAILLYRGRKKRGGCCGESGGCAGSGICEGCSKSSRCADRKQSRSE